MDISVVIPLLNEKDSLQELTDRIVRVMQQNNYSYEIIFVDDGSTDGSWNKIQELAQQNPHIKAIKFRKNFGKSQALNAAFEMAQGDVVITMDADLQDFPEEIPGLYNMVVNENYDLVSGWKQKRQDPVLTKNLPSKVFNKVARKTSGLELHDFNCGLKAYRKDVVKNIYLRSDMHRYIPVLAKNAGFTQITEKKVQHVARKHGESKFGSSRFAKGFLDLITVWFVTKFGNRPMHLFGALGSIMFVVGFFIAFFVGAYKLYTVYYLGGSGKLVTDNPWFFIALTTMILGTQLFLAGFLGELLVRNDTKDYFQVEEIIE